MDLSTATLLGVILLLGFNRAMFLGERIFARPRLFWSAQVLNLLGACYMVLVGVPAFVGSLRVVNYLMAGLLVLHIVVNNRRLALWVRAQRAQVQEEQDGRREALARRLSEGADHET